MKKYHELKKGYDNVSKKKYSDKAKNDAKKDVEKVFTQIKQLRSDFQRKIAKQQGVVRKAEYKFEQSLKAFDNRRVLVSKVQRRLPIQIASKEQADATTSVCTATSYAHRYVMKLTTRADAQKKAGDLAKEWAHMQVKEAKKFIDRHKQHGSTSVGASSQVNPQLEATPIAAANGANSKITNTPTDTDTTQGSTGGTDDKTNSDSNKTVSTKESSMGSVDEDNTQNDSAHTPVETGKKIAILTKGFVSDEKFWSEDGLGNTRKHEQGIMELRFHGIELVNI